MANLEKILPKLKEIPLSPGVYRFLSADGQILYVGKSLRLRNRVRSYFAPSQKWEKVAQMLPFIDDLSYTVCETHLEARLLECHLIKTIQPRFNRQMKGDSRYVYLRIREGELPRVVAQRGPDCFGPYRSQGNLKRFFESLRLLYPLADDGEIRFDYHPLPLRLSPTELISTSAVLRGCFSVPATCSRLISALEDAMTSAASSLAFEQAAFYRELLPTMRWVYKSAGAWSDFVNGEYYVWLALAKAKRHLYIRNGLVLDSVTSEDPFNKEMFLFQARALPDPAISDKAKLDYQDIVFSEVMGLEEGQVERLVR